MSKEDLKALVAELVSKFGRVNVRKHLVIEGVSIHTADQLVRAKYDSVPRDLLIVAVRRAAEALKKAAAA